MNLLYRSLALAGLPLLVATATFAQDGTDLIDDSPKQGKEAASENPQPGKKAKSAPGPRRRNDGDLRPQQPGRKVDLSDDLTPEQKEAAERNAARKNENAIPDNLADALARALHNSPSILVADAKVRQAQAELNEVRLSVVQELTLAFQRRASNKAVLAHHEAAVQTGQESPLAKTDVQQAVMEDETRILYLLGVGAEQTAEAPTSASAGPKAGPGMGMMGGGMGMQGMMSGMSGGMRGPMGGMAPMGGGMGGMTPGMRGPMGGGMMGGAGGGRTGPGTSSALDGGRPSDLPENVRKFLDKRLDVDFAKGALADVLTYLQAAGDSDVAFIIESPEEWKPNPEGGADEWVSVTLVLKQVTVRSALQALADIYHCAFVFRDYGILVLGPEVEGTDAFESFRSAGTHMIAPPSPLSGGGGVF
jgi:hypothetical protein